MQYFFMLFLSLFCNYALQAARKPTAAPALKPKLVTQESLNREFDLINDLRASEPASSVMAYFDLLAPKTADFLRNDTAFIAPFSYNALMAMSGNEKHANAVLERVFAARLQVRKNEVAQKALLEKQKKEAAADRQKSSKKFLDRLFSVKVTS